MENKPLDAVEMTRHIRDKMYEDTKGLTTDELLRYFKERGEAASRKVQERDAIREAEQSRTSLR